MNKTIKHSAMCLAFLLALPMGNSLHAQDKVSADIGAELVSSYIWRGQDLGGAAFQPSLSLSYKGLSLSAWGSVGFSQDDIKEFDLTLAYTTGGLTLALTDYWFDNGPGYFHYGSTQTAHVFEAQVGYDFGPVALNWYTNIGGNDGVNKDGNRAYSSFISLSAPFTLGGLQWSAEVGAVPWATSFYNVRGSDDCGARGFEVATVSLQAEKALTITPSYLLPLFARAVWNPATEGAYFIFGLRF